MRLKQQHFYFGAILTSIIEYNQDASIAMVERNEDNRGIYLIQTNHSQTCCLFFKHTSQKRSDTESWQFLFSENDIECLHKYYDDKVPTFIYLLCRRDELKDSEIAVIKLDEFRNLNQNSLTVKIDKGKRRFAI